MGIRDEKNLTNLVFWAQHPEAALRKIRPDEVELAEAWVTNRGDALVRPALARLKENDGAAAEGAGRRCAHARR